MRKLLLASVAVTGILVSGAAMAFPGLGANPLGPEYVITFTDSGVSTALNPVYSVNPGPYDRIEDTYFGVVNNMSTKTISGFTLASLTQNIGGFDGDGIDGSLYLNIPNNVSDTTGYGGPNAFFTANTGLSVFVNFITPIAAGGGTDIFSLEEPVALNNIIIGTPEASTWAMLMLGFGGIGLAAYGKKRRTALTA